MKLLACLILTLATLAFAATAPTAVPAQGNCGTCAGNALSYGSTAFDICTNDGGSFDFCNAYMVAERCWYMTRYCTMCSSEAMAIICDNPMNAAVENGERLAKHDARIVDLLQRRYDEARGRERR